MDDIPDVKEQYKLGRKAMHDKWVYIGIQREMYSLLQTGLLAQELLEGRLTKKWIHTKYTVARNEKTSHKTSPVLPHHR